MFFILHTLNTTTTLTNNIHQNAQKKTTNLLFRIMITIFYVCVITFIIWNISFYFIFKDKLIKIQPKSNVIKNTSNIITKVASINNNPMIQLLLKDKSYDILNRNNFTYVLLSIPNAVSGFGSIYEYFLIVFGQIDQYKIHLSNSNKNVDNPIINHLQLDILFIILKFCLELYFLYLSFYACFYIQYLSIMHLFIGINIFIIDIILTYFIHQFLFHINLNKENDNLIE